MSVQTECRTWKLVFESFAEVKPDFAIAMSVQTECRTWKLVFKSYAEVQPDFAIAKIQRAHPEIQIFSSPNIAPRKVFHTLKSASNPISTSTSAHFPHAKKMKSGYNFLSHADYQNVRSSNAMPHLNATIPHLFTTDPRFTQNSTEQ